MPLLRDDDLVRIDLPENGEWVEVKRRLSKGDETAVQKAWLAGVNLPLTAINELSKRGLTPEQIASVAFENGLEAGALLEQATFATLDVAVRRWSFEEPVTPEALRALDVESVNAIVERLEGMYPGPRTDDERKNSGAPTQALSLAAAMSPATSNGSS